MRARELREWVVNDSGTTTPMTLAIDVHYRRLGLNKIWTKKRYMRLCRKLGSTEYELASLVGLNHAAARQYLKRERFPPPVCILLSLLETYTTGDSIDDAIEAPVFPLEELVK